MADGMHVSVGYAGSAGVDASFRTVLRAAILGLMTSYPFGSLEDFSELDLLLLVTAAGDYEQALLRVNHASAVARRRGVLPVFRTEDISTVRAASWESLRRDEIGDEQSDGPGGRLYLLAFEGALPYIKVGMVEGRKAKSLRDRVRRHEHVAEIHQYFLVEAWASQPCATIEATKEWEERVLARLNTLVTHGGAAQRTHEEYFRGIPFNIMVAAIELERSKVVGTPRHPGVVYET
ncbi:hypothetical protein ABT117_30435 [Streptomyces sp. NPDC002262]|uniref:hypothetical protein n=1 Tax=Streptomyces sp. NPDC002262 TaxID=3154414 RepID=UPI00331BA0FF